MTQLSIKHLKTKRGDVTHSLLMLSNRCQILCLPVVNVCRSQGKRDWGTTLIPLAFYRSSKESDTPTGSSSARNDHPQRMKLKNTVDYFS